MHPPARRYSARAAVATVALVALGFAGVTPAAGIDDSYHLYAGSISGTVSGEDTGGVGVAGVRISVFDENWDPTIASTTTDENGKFTLSALPAGAYYIAYGIENDMGYLTEWYPNQASIPTAEPVRVNIEQDTGGVDAVLNLAQDHGGGARIAGKVLDEATQHPILVSVELWAADGSNLVDQTWTQYGGYDAGQFQFTSLPAGNYRLRYGALNPNGYSDYVPEWHLDAADIASAAVVSISATAYRELASASLLQHTKQLTSTRKPTLGGTPSVGSTITAYVNAWEPAPVALEYQWRRDGADIPGADGPTYTPVNEDAAHAISVSVTGSKVDYRSVTKVSSSTSMILGGALTPAPTPVISGAPIVHQTLTAIPGDWGPAPVSLAYQWYSDGVKLFKATQPTYWVTWGQAGQAITVKVTGTKLGYVPVTKTSAATGITGILEGQRPEIAGNPTVGETLVALAGPWMPDLVTLTYQWQRGGENIPHANDMLYTVVQADVGYSITVVVTGSKPGYASVQMTSYATGPVPGVIPSPAPTTPTTTRLSGSNRFATAAAISKGSFSAGVPVVYIANGYGFPDALAGAPAAGRDGGPVLLVTRDAIPDAVKSELNRLRPGKIIILGGTGVISGSVATALRIHTTGPVTRLSGSDRFATAAAISKGSFSAGVPAVYIANGYGFPDALAGAPAAGRDGGPVLLVTKGAIPDAVKSELNRLRPAKIIVLGGTGVISNSVATALRNYTNGPVTRLSGSDRFATSAAVSKGSFSAGVPVAYIANGYGFPDALAGAPAAGRDGGPVLLVTKGAIPDAVKTELNRLRPARIIILGGTGVISNSVATALKGYLR